MPERPLPIRMSVIAIVQARMGSQRFPGKSMALIEGRPMIAHVLERASRIAGVDRVTLTTPNAAADKVLCKVAVSMGIESWPDDHSDLLGCFYRCAVSHHADVVVRVTGDCPLLDPDASSAVLARFLAARLAYCSNVGEGTDGLDTEVMSIAALTAAHQEATDVYDRHHVTPWIRKRSLRFPAEHVVTRTIAEKWSVDTEDDLVRVRRAYPGSRPVE